MADGARRSYRALVLCPMRHCPSCAHQVAVRDDACTECGRHLPKPPRLPRPRQELRVIPATGFGLEHAAAAMVSLDVAALPSIN
ncbi:MAG TPA: hypothetical protein VG650_11320 [Mycobacteriales bacterium]|nr:hypothetical protein [Mycobacteriales bacterium]